MTYFRHPYPPAHIVQKPTYNAQKIIGELSGLFLLFTVKRIRFPDNLLDMRHFHSHLTDLWAIQNLTENRLSVIIRTYQAKIDILPQFSLKRAVSSLYDLRKP